MSALKKYLINWQLAAPNVIRFSAIGAVSTVGFSTAMTSVFCAVLLFSWLSSGTILSHFEYCLMSPIGKTLIIFFVFLSIGCGYGSVSWSERLDSLWSWRKIFYVLILLPIFADELWKKRFIISFLGFSVLGLLVSYLSWSGLIGIKIENTPGVVLQNWASQGMIFSIAILISYFLAFSENEKYKKYFLFLGILFLLNIIFITPGRSGYIALLMVFLTIGVSKFSLRKLPYIFIIMCLISIVAFFASSTMKDKIILGWTQAQQFSQDKSPPLNSITFRLTAYENTLEIIKRNSILGYGTGSFETVYAEHVQSKYQDWRNLGTSDPHNQYLFILTENGVIGFIIFFSFLLSPWFIRIKKDQYFFIGIGVLATWMVSSLFSSHFRTFPEGHLVGLFLGAMFSTRYFRPANEGTM